MKIKKIRMVNFKKFTDKTIEFDEINKISGKNGCGKTTIKEAILFCLYNKTLSGSSSDTSNYIKNGVSTSCKVSITFVKELAEFTLKRERSMKGSKLTFLDGSQSIEDSAITQRELDTIIPDYNKFQAVFNIGYFMNLPDKDKREFILELTPNIDKKDLFLKLGGKNSDIAKYGIHFGDSIKKELLAKGRETKQKLQKAEIELRAINYIDVPDDKISDVSAKLIRLKDDKNKWVKLQQEWEIYKVKKENIREALAKNNALKDKLLSLKVVGIEKPSNEKINKLKIRYEQLKRKINIPKEKCPTCLRTITDKHKDMVARINNKNNKKANEIQEKIEKLEDKYFRDLNIYEEDQKTKNEIEIIKSQITNIKKPKAPSGPPVRIDMIKLTNEIKRLERIDIDNKIARETMSQAKKHNEEMNVIKNNLEKLLFKESDNLLNLRRLYEIFAPSGLPAEEMKLKLKPIIARFKELIPGFKINTIKHLKNNIDTKEVFEVMVKGKEYYKLSLGEKMKVDIAMSMVINDMIKEDIGIFFLDNSEVIDKLPEIDEDGQWFISTVTNSAFKIDE